MTTTTSTHPGTICPEIPTHDAPQAADLEASLNEALEREVSLRSLELTLLRLPQIESFRSAIRTRHERLALYVRWTDDNGHWGIGECSCRPDPYYSGELVAGAVQIREDRGTSGGAGWNTCSSIHAQLDAFRLWQKPQRQGLWHQLTNCWDFGVVGLASLGVIDMGCHGRYGAYGWLGSFVQVAP